MHKVKKFSIKMIIYFGFDIDDPELYFDFLPDELIHIIFDNEGFDLRCLSSRYAKLYYDYMIHKIIKSLKVPKPNYFQIIKF